MLHNSSVNSLNLEFNMIREKAKLIAAQRSLNKINSSAYLCEAQGMILRIESKVESHEEDVTIDESQMRVVFLSSAIPYSC